MTEPDDDGPVGRVLSRREAMRLLALSTAAVAVGCKSGPGAGADTTSAGAGTASASAAGAAATPACVVRPELTVGPYFVDKQLNRSDIRANTANGAIAAGVPLDLTFNVSEISGGQCRSLAGAMVDVWHCDATGVYSAVNDPMLGASSEGKNFLRGYQLTSADGTARFTTIYPGWYRGRTVHIHFKIRAPGAAAAAGQTNNVYEFTSQLFFDEALSDRVFASAPYAGKGKRDTTNASDQIFQQSNGQLLLAVAPAGSGYRAAFDIGLDLSNAAVGASDRDGGPGGPGGRRPPGGPPPRG